MKRILLIGNPNVGKSALFGALTGRRVEVANYPGTTVEVLQGRWVGDVLLDSPGTYDLTGTAEEGVVTASLLPQADLVVNVVDSLHLERDLYLTLEIKETGRPFLVALNFADELRREGRRLRPELLAERLGVPVVLTAANLGEGLGALKAAVRGFGLLASAPKVRRIDESLTASQARRQEADELAAQVVAEPGRPSPIRQALGSLTVRPWPGILLLLLTVLGLYYLLGYWVGQRVVAVTEQVLFDQLYLPWIRHQGELWGLGGLPGRLLLGPYGLLTQFPAYLFGLLLPLVAAFYLALSFLEDSGYLPRLATLVDRLFRELGLNGRAVIPVILGLGCVTMATASTRLLSSRRERSLATFLLALAVPCSAQTAVVAGLLGPRGTWAVAAYVLFLAGTFVVAGILAAQAWPGEPRDLLLDLPPLRWPALQNLIRQSAAKTSAFLREAGTVFLFGSLLVGLADGLGWLGRLERGLGPFFRDWLHLPAATAQAFVMGLLRRDFGAAGLYRLALTDRQAVVAAITLSLFVPCLASVLLIFRERGLREGTVIWLSTFAIAFLVGGAATRLLGA